MKVKELVELLLTFDQEIDVVNEDLFYIDSAHIENADDTNADFIGLNIGDSFVVLTQA